MYKIFFNTSNAFTNIVMLREDGTTYTAKIPVKADDLTQGIVEGLALFTQREKLKSAKELLTKTVEITIGTDFAKEVIMQNKGAKVGMITTRGFRDILEMRRISKSEVANLKLPKPVVLIPRFLRIEIDERMKYTGEIITPLNEANVRKAVEKLKANGVGSIVIGFMQSYNNPEHEEKAAQIIKKYYPEVEVILSSAIPYPMEFERFNTAAVSAYIMPPCKTYLNNVKSNLRELGYTGNIFAATSTGGIIAFEEAEKNPILTLLSGSNPGALMANNLGNQLGYKNTLLAELGDSEFDITVIPNGEIMTTTDTIIRDQRVVSDVVDVINVGIAGNTVARLDMRGLLALGPENSGTNPGPACYGRGGQKPTVIDADLILGYLSPDKYFENNVKLDVNLANNVLKDVIAKPQGVDVVNAAYAIHSLACGIYSGAVSLACIKKGYDAEDFALIASGRIGPGYIFELAQSLRIKEIYIPKAAAVANAIGLMFSDFKYTGQRFFQTLLREPDLVKLNKYYGDIEKGLIDILIRDKKDVKDIKIKRGATIRYYGQIWGIDAEMPETDINTPVAQSDLNALTEDFYRRYKTKYGHVNTKIPIEIAGIKSAVIGIRPKLKMPEISKSDKDASKAITDKREVYFKSAVGYLKTPCYDGSKLKSGNVIEGPALIEDSSSTLVVLPKCHVVVDRFGNYCGKLS